MISKLEKIIRISKKVWRKVGIKDDLINKMINSMANTKYPLETIDVDIITEEHIIKATELYIINEKKLEEEKIKWEKSVK